jgi:hypothetical protein
LVELRAEGFVEGREFILENAVGNESFVDLWRCIAFVGADLSAHNRLFVRINSHLQPPQLPF